MRVLEWFSQAGLSETREQTLVSDITPPLGQKMRNALVDLFQMCWGQDNPELMEEEQLGIPASLQGRLTGLHAEYARALWILYIFIILWESAQ
jgi:hypothetical protein